MDKTKENENYLLEQILLLRREHEQLQLEHDRQAEKLHELEQSLQELVRSKPWRYYTALRVSIHMLLACRSKAGCRNTAKTILLHAKDYINGRPALKRRVMSTLRYFPGMAYRLKKLGRAVPEEEHYTPEFNKNAQIIYNRLKAL